MDESFLSVISEAESLNSDVFSLPRLQLLASLANLEPDGAVYRELKAALRLSDGALYANIEALRKMGYVKAEDVELEAKELTAYSITPEGKAELGRIRKWLCKLFSCGGGP